MAFPVFLDTCAIFGAYLTDTILSLAEQGGFSPYWSQRVLESVVRNVVAQRGLPEEMIRARVEMMARAFPDAMVEGFEPLIPVMTNHRGDRHVLAACVVSPAHTLVTFNVKDFPPGSVHPYDIDVIHPDEFLLNQLALEPQRTMAGVAEMLRRNDRPPQDLAALAHLLGRSGVPRFAAAVLAQRMP